ncbi:MAG: NAD(P)/FAD-dependent oxidoreductase [Bdellovibrionia bacterium]
MQKQDVLIIGGGVIGLSAAYELSSRGVAVTLIDKGDPGYGCSYGNAGWLTPCFSMPLPMPGMLLKSIGWLMDPDSPLRIKPQPSILLMRWLARFLMSMNQKQALRAVSVLTDISKYSLEAYSKLDQKYPGAIGFEQKGLLMVSATDAGFAAAVQEMDLVAPHGVPGQKMNEDEVKALEPGLRARLRGGVYFPKEAHAEPLQISRILAEAAIANGAKIISRAEVFAFNTSNGKIDSIRTTRGDMRADQYVLATGTWSTNIARELGLRVPILGGKGYAITVKSFDKAPTHPIMILERKIAVTPRKGGVRLAGTLELVDSKDDSITPRRLDGIMRGSQEFMYVPENPEIVEIWRGLRPCTPDGVPVIGRPKRYSNLVVSAGHQMLGLQSGMGSGRFVADLVTGEKSIFDPYPFRADRF